MRGHLTKRNIIIAASVFVVFIAVAAYWPRTIAFSFAGDNCVGHVSFLPDTQGSKNDGQYTLDITDTINVAGYPVLGTNVCATPVDAPQEGSTRLVLAPFGLELVGTSFVVHTPSAPVVSVANLNKPLPAAKPVVFSLSASDEIFTYNLSSSERQVECSSANQAVNCELAELELKQGETHELTVERQFNDDRPELIAKKKIDILPAVEVTGSSVAQDETVYGKPDVFTLTVDKDLSSADASLIRITKEGEEPQEVAVEVVDREIAVRPVSELARESTYELRLASVESNDGSTLANEHVTSFSLSGGPKVAGVNIGTSSVDSNATVVLQLDQPLKPGQDIAKFVKFAGGNAVISADNSKIYIKLGNLGRCAAFSVNVAKGLVSEHDITSESEWKINSRTRCHTISTIGYSVRGRPINAYYFGNGSQTILFTGAIHGNELSSKYVMDAWIGNLEANAASIPADKRIVVIPVVSPDSVAAVSRYNARNVNLNRNFPTHNWTSDITVSGGRKEQGAGGPSPLSEPEAAALARFTQQISPRMVVTYHSLGSLVNGNDVGIANTLGPAYSRMTGYSYIPNAATAATFGFEMTGTYEDWLAERGVPAILIELNTNTGYHFAQNRDAMWAMVRG